MQPQTRCTRLLQRQMAWRRCIDDHQELKGLLVEIMGTDISTGDVDSSNVLSFNVDGAVLLL
jgi:hypothetical protein